jgi:hypothetical protein
MNRAQFLETCGFYKVPVVDFTKEELEREIKLFKV